VLFTTGDGTSFSFFDCQQSKAWTALRPEQRAQQLGALSPERRAAREQSAGARLWDAVRQAAQAGDAAALGALHRDVAAALANWRAAAEVVTRRAGEGSFSSAPLTALLTDVLRLVEEIAPAGVSAAEPPPDASAGASGAAGPGGAAPSGAPSGGASSGGAPAVLATREDALRQLAEVTAFFHRTEPHSPLAYTLDDAMRRARLSWPELLADLVPDRGQREAIQQRLGIRSEAG
jgi:type VI secretion system protein ImpA